MMKRTLSMLLTVAILVLCIPGAAFATNETEATTVISYTYEKSFVDEYVINIPSQYTITEDGYFDILASKMDISDNKIVRVLLDPTKNALSGSTMNLNSLNGGTIQCDVYVKEIAAGESAGALGVANTSYIVALFKSETANTPYRFGRVCLIPHADNNASEGVYTGTLHFDIVLEDNS